MSGCLDILIPGFLKIKFGYLDVLPWSHCLPSMWYCSIKIQYIRIIPIPILGLRSLQARSLRREMRCWTLKMHHICIETRNPIYLVMGTVSIQTGWALAYPKNGGKHPFLITDAFSKALIDLN